MNVLLTNFLLAVAWVALTGRLTPMNFVAGFIIGFFMLWLSQSSASSTAYFTRLPRFLSFSLFFLWELAKANVKVAYDILTPQHHMRPGIIAVPLDVQSDIGITLLSNVVTLTPGTLSLNVSDDRKTLYIHAMYVTDPDDFREEIKQGFEQRILELYD